MMGARRVVIGHADPSCLKTLKEQVMRAGYLVLFASDNGRQLAQVVFSQQPDIVILGADLRIRDGLELARVFGQQWAAPVAFIGEPTDGPVLERALDAGVQAFLIRPVDDTQLVAAMEVAISQFRLMVRLRDENRRLQDSLETRRLVERAKGVLMQREGWSEEEAYGFLRKKSMDQGLPLRFVARQVLEEVGRAAGWGKNG